MRGLIIKDLLSIKNNWKQMIILFIGCLLISIALGNYLLTIVIIPVMLTSSGITTFNTDEFYNTEAYTLSMPLSRKQIVTSKYMFTLLTVIFSFLIGCAIYALLYVMLDIFNVENIENGLNFAMIQELILLELASVFVDFIFYPIIYKYGCEKSRLVLMGIVTIFLGIVSILSVYLHAENITFIDYNKIVTFLTNYSLYVAIVLAIITTIISYFVSLLVYKHKDY